MRWFASAGVYTAAGLASSIAVGSILGATGGLLEGVLSDSATIAAGLLAAVGLGLREVGLIHFPLPQLRRQTSQRWGHVMRTPIAAALWGLDIGTAFSTFRTFSGAWMLLVLALVLGNPLNGALLFSAFWIGRTLSVWLVPLITGRDATATPVFMDAIMASRSAFRRTHVAALTMVALWLIAMALVDSQVMVDGHEIIN